MYEHNEVEHVKEVYARFGLAVYYAQVLEHGLVNLLVILNLIASQARLAVSRDQWNTEVNAFYDHHFQATMGRMIRRLRDVAQLDAGLEQLLYDTLSQRNWLVHDFFRERVTEFSSTTGREQMLGEIDNCRDLFQSVDERLESLIGPLRRKFGITDELVAQEYQRMIAERKDIG